MFKLKFAKVFNNSIFDKYNIEPSVEDYVAVNDNIFCVADGVTQDLTDGTTAGYPDTLEGINHIMEKYPNPSGTYMAAKICCENFVKYVSETDKHEITKESLLNVVKKVNLDISKINEGRPINYITEDIYCCQAVGGIIIENSLYCFSVGDCHITVLDKDFNRIFDTPSNEKFLEYEQRKLKPLNFDWEHAEYRYLLRRFFRNNPELKENGEDITYGALGEKTAEYYIHIFKIDLINAKYVCAYSDGYEPNFETLDGIKQLAINPESTKFSGREKTLVLYENENI